MPISTFPKADPGFCDGETKQALTGEDRAEKLDGSKIEEASPNSPLQLPAAQLPNGGERL